MLRTSQRSLTTCPDVTIRHRFILFDELSEIALLAISDLRGRLVRADALIILASLRIRSECVSEERSKAQTLIVLFAVWHVVLHCVHRQGNVV